MTSVDLDALNLALPAYTTVLSANFEAEPDWSARLTLTLQANPATTPDTLRLTCCGVAGLSLHGFGGGLTQVLCLRGTDIRDQQLDRLNFAFTDLEENVIAFQCRTFEFVTAPA